MSAQADSATAPAAPAGTVMPQPALVKASIRWPFRLVITLHALAAVVQTIFAGRFLAGDYDLLRAHFVNSQVVGGLAIAQVVTGLVYWRAGRGLRWPALASIGLLALEPLQIAAGIKRVIGVHVPLGVLIVSLCLLFLVWAWRPTFGLRRDPPEVRPQRHRRS